MAETSGGLPVETTDTPTVGGLQGTSTINVGGQKISTKGALQGQALLDAMQEEYSRRVPDSSLGRFNTFLEGMKDAVAITSRDPGSAMAARDQEKRLRDESLFQMRANMAALKGQMAQQAQTSAMMNGVPQGGGVQGTAPGATPEGGMSPAQQMINSLPASLQGRGRQLATEGQFDALAKLTQDMEMHKSELQKNTAAIDAMPEGPAKDRMRRQVLDKTYGTYEYVNDKGEVIKYTLGGPNDPTFNKPAPAPEPTISTIVPAAAPAPAVAKPTVQGTAAPAPVVKPAAPAAAPAAVAPAPVVKPAAPAAAPAAVAPAAAPAAVAPAAAPAAVAPSATPTTGSGVGVAPFKAVAPRPGVHDDTGLPNTATPGTDNYNVQRNKNAETATAIQKAAAEKQLEAQLQEQKARLERETHAANVNVDTAAEADKASNKIYGEEFAKVPLEKERASNTIAAADRVIQLADDPTYKKLMGYFNGGNKAASLLVGVLNNVPGHLFDKDRMESAMTSLGFNEAERTKFNQLKTDSASLGIEYTANMFKGARLGIGLEKLGSTGKGVSSDFTPATNKLFAQVTKNNAEFVLNGHRTFRDQWAPEHPGKTWGDFIQSREYDSMLDNHLANQRALTAGTPVRVERLSPEAAREAARTGSPTPPRTSILDQYRRPTRTN